MKINYVVRINGTCSTDTYNELKERYPNSGFSTASSVFQYIADIAKYCEEAFGVRSLYTVDNDRVMMVISIGINTGDYDSVVIEIEQCDFLVKDP